MLISPNESSSVSPEGSRTIRCPSSVMDSACAGCCTPFWITMTSRPGTMFRARYSSMNAGPESSPHSENSSFATAAAIAQRGTGSPSSKIAPAMSRISGAKPPSGSRRFSPMPTTMKSTPPVSMSALASVRMPTHLRPARYTSFTHLMTRCLPHSDSSARHTATAAALVMRAASPIGSALRTTIVRYSPVPCGDTKLRPRRPRPAVWQSDTTSVPCGAPAAASSFAVRFVEATSS